ncbi:MAG: hypothetical protein GXO32_05765 [Crenarchaeota archaeon]|nr:hypothetical protein [Thermoproteota archaeon]
MERLWLAIGLMIAALTGASIAILVVASSAVRMEAYTWSTLYLGSAIVTVIATLATIPFAIWTLIMQSRYGPYVLRMFIYRIVNLFIMMIVSVLVTGVAMVYSFMSRAYVVAYAAIIAESAVIIPVIGTYVLKLMTLKPSEIVETVIRGSTKFDEAIALLFKLANIYIQEAVEEDAVLMILRKALSMLRKSKLVEHNPPTPPTWHEFRAFIDTLIKKEVPLPSRRLMGALMREFMMWLLRHRKDRAAAMLMRHYRRLAIKYLEIRLPSDVIRDLLVRPIVEPVESVEVKPELKALAYEQLHAFLRHVRTMTLRGEITRRELCSCIAVLGKHLTEFAECDVLESVREYISVLDREFRCRSLPSGRRIRSRGQEQPKPIAREGNQENASQPSGIQPQSVGDEVRPA